MVKKKKQKYFALQNQESFEAESLDKASGIMSTKFDQMMILGWSFYGKVKFVFLHRFLQNHFLKCIKD